MMDVSSALNVFIGTSLLLSVPSYGLAPSAQLNRFKNSLPPSFDVVVAGGYHAVFKEYMKKETELGREKFNQFKSDLPSDFDVVAAGGYDAVFKMSVDPKAELVSLVAEGLAQNDGSISKSASDGKLEALAGLLEAQGKGFNADLVDGEWAAVSSKEGKKSPKFQKFVDSKSVAKKASSNFDVKAMTFLNENFVLKGKGRLQATVRYNPSTDAFSKSADGKILLRRITCDIVGCNWKFWKLPKLPLPLRATGGYLHFAYLDDEIRVTRGNRGGLFVHFRPTFLEKVLA